MYRTYPHLLFDCELSKWVEHGYISCVKTNKSVHGRSIWVDIETGDEFVLCRLSRSQFVFVKSYPYERL